ncbi:DNA polymerase beta superfamily protein [Portibacter marinus]|uniref:DNA polymerase beta superfamily protein n=1 Tax=Portibacter marinus TaxID=2898660 RepID=UPI001F23934D|nr:nucleotidyltransferase domain-containing protein [Portibacter marinus]
MTIEDLKENDLIIMECISGSRAYGLETPTSDTDIKGVFILPQSDFYGLNYIPQVSNETNDIVYYELGRFMELLVVNNPNILELLNSPQHAVLLKHPYLDIIEPSQILSKLCENTFGKFAISQIKKAKGLNKKILKPIDKKRKTVLEFCYVNYGNGSVPLTKFLSLKGFKQQDCGLTKIPNMKDVYGLYHNEDLGYKGIMKNDFSNSISLSSIPKNEIQQCLLYFNHDGYSSYCKDYKEYWLWVENRNEDRYENTMSHGKNYDAKNMMHTFRLLEMAIEIARDEKINVLRKDREFLLEIKSGKFDYNELLEKASEKQNEMEQAFKQSNLQEKPDDKMIRNLAFEIRKKFYALEKYRVGKGDSHP